MLTLDAISKRFALKAGYFAAARRHVYAVREVSLRIAGRDLRAGRRVGQRQDHHCPPGGGHVPARPRRHHLPRPRR